MKKERESGGCERVGMRAGRQAGRRAGKRLWYGLAARCAAERVECLGPGVSGPGTGTAAPLSKMAAGWSQPRVPLTEPGKSGESGEG